MSEKRYIHIRNWDRYQHDKRRAGAPWHKEHANQLDNDAYLGLSLSQRGLLQGLRLMYGRRHPEGVESTQAKTLLAHQHGDNKHFRRHLRALSDAGFITVCASKTLATRAQDASSVLAQEVEVEEEVEKEDSIPPSVMQDPEPQPATNGRTDGWNLETLDPQTELAKIATAADWLA